MNDAPDTNDDDSYINRGIVGNYGYKFNKQVPYNEIKNIFQLTLIIFVYLNFDSRFVINRSAVRIRAGAPQTRLFLFLIVQF